jgi:hypothetical protein
MKSSDEFKFVGRGPEAVLIVKVDYPLTIRGLATIATMSDLVELGENGEPPSQEQMVEMMPTKRKVMAGIRDQLFDTGFDTAIDTAREANLWHVVDVVEAYLKELWVSPDKE